MRNGHQIFDHLLLWQERLLVHQLNFTAVFCGDVVAQLQ